MDLGSIDEQATHTIFDIISQFHGVFGMIPVEIGIYIWDQQQQPQIRYLQPYSCNQHTDEIHSLIYRTSYHNYRISNRSPPAYLL